MPSSINNTLSHVPDTIAEDYEWGSAGSNGLVILIYHGRNEKNYVGGWIWTGRVVYSYMGADTADLSARAGVTDAECVKGWLVGLDGVVGGFKRHWEGIASSHKGGLTSEGLCLLALIERGMLGTRLGMVFFDLWEGESLLGRGFLEDHYIRKLLPWYRLGELDRDLFSKKRELSF